MHHLQIQMFGLFAVSVDERPVTHFATTRERAFLAYLAAAGAHPQSRAALVELLWPDRPTTVALGGLRQALARLRTAFNEHTPELGNRLLVADRQTARLDLDIGLVDIDLLAFQQLIADCQHHAHTELVSCRVCIERLRRAVDLYQGEFLIDIAPENAEPFHAWVMAMRATLQEQVVWALQRLVDWSITQRRLTQGINDARHLLTLLPWHEETHRKLMRLLAWQGDTNSALVQYETCRSILSDELGTVPDVTTRDLHLEILTGRLSALEAAKPVNPYRMLRAFGAGDAGYFFGRERYIDALLAIVGRQPFVAVVGPSGSGKSSLLHAGLVARLPARATGVWAGKGWHIVEFRPGADPLFHLAAAIAPLLPQPRSPAELAEELQSGRQTLIQLLQSFWDADAPRLLFVIDQFEEIFSLAPDPQAAREFLDLLFATLQDHTVQPGAVVCVAAIRADFVSQALAHRKLADALQNDSIFLGPMDSDELVRAIVEPARMHGVTLEPGLLERLLTDVDSQPGALPMLQFVLALLWEQQVEHHLTHSAYEALGGIAGALAAYCDEHFERLAPVEQLRARRLFLQMVQVGEQTVDTRRLVAKSELDDTDWEIARKLADARLLVTGLDLGSETVEVAHEALIHAWPRLHAWIETDREFRLWQGRLRASIHQWQSSGQDSGALLRGVALAEADQWRSQRQGDLGALALRYVEASLTQRQAEEAAAEQQRRREHSHLLALRAQVAMTEQNTEMALSLAMQAVRVNPSPPAQRILSRAAYAPGTRRRLRGHDGPVLQVVLAPGSDPALALSASADCTVILWDLKTGGVVRRFIGHKDIVHGVAFDGAGQIAASVGADGLLIVWQVATGAILARLSDAGVGFGAIALSPDGRTAVVGAANGELLVWDVQEGQLVHRLYGHRGPVNCVALATDGRMAITGGADHSVRTWEIVRGQALATMASHDSHPHANQEWVGHSAPVTGVVFATDGRTAYSVATDTAIHRWDVERATLERKAGTGIGLTAIALLPDSNQALLCTFDSRLLVFDLERFEHKASLSGHSTRVQSVAVDAGGSIALTGAADHDVRLWNLRNGAEVRRFTGPQLAASAMQIDISGDGRYLIAGRLDGALSLWDYASGRMLRHWQGHESMIWAGVRFLPDNRRALSAAGNIFGMAVDSTLRLWDVETGDELRRFVGHDSQVWDLALSADGRFAFSGSHDGTLRRWEIATGACDVLLDLGPQAVLSIAVSPDGRTVLAGPGKGNATNPEYALRQIDLATGSIMRRLEGHSEAIVSIAISPDGRYCASGAHDTAILLWDLTDGRLLRRLDGHTGSPVDLLFTPDSRMLLSASHDRTILLWDVEQGEAIRSYIGHEGPVLDLVYLPDASGFLSVAQDNTIRQWRIDATLEKLFTWIEANRGIDA